MALTYITNKTFSQAKHNDTWLQLDNIFSHKHSLYELHLRGFQTTGATSAYNIHMSLIDGSGNLLSDSNYHFGQQGMRSNADGRFNSGSTGQTSWRTGLLAYYEWTGNGRLLIHTPYESNRVTSFQGEMAGSTSEHYTIMQTGTYNNATRITGIRFFVPVTGDYALQFADVTVYGLGK